VSDLLGKAAREALLIPLPRLPKEQVGRWIAEAAPSLVGAIDAVHDSSEGNPLFVRELLATVAVRATAAAALPFGIRAAINEHLGLLSPGARALVETMSILGRESSRSALGPLLSAAGGFGDPATLLEEARTKGVIVDGHGDGEGDGVLRFTHALLRDELHAGLPPGRRAELHRAAWKAAADPATALHHALEGARPEDLAELLATAMTAVEEASSRLAFGDAAKAGERALARVGGEASVLASDLHRLTADALMFAGERDAAMAHYRRAAELASELGAAERLALAALGAAYEPSMSPRPEVTRLLRRAAAALPAGDSPLAAAVLGRLARALLPPQPHELAEYLDLRQRSLAMARRIGQREVLLDVLRTAAEGFQGTFPLDEQYALNAEAITIAEELGRVAGVVPLLPWQVAFCLARADMGGAKREVARAEALLGRFREPHYRWRAPLIRALPMILEGNFAEADALQRRALDEARASGDRMGLLAFSIQRIMLHYQRGDAEESPEIEEVSRRTQENLPLGELFLSLGHAIAGRVDEARVCLSRLDRAAVAGVPGASTLGWACVEAELADLAPLFLELADAAVGSQPFVFGPFGLVTVGATSLLRGRLLLLLGRDVEAEGPLREARALGEKLGALPTMVQADLALAEIAQRAGRAGPDVADIAARARALGMKRVLRRAEALGGRGESPAPAPASASIARELVLEQQGPVWIIGARPGTSRVTVKDGRGLAYLTELVRRPHREVHVLELTGHGERGDAGPLLDAPAKAAYRARAEALRDELAEATDHNDLGRAERLRAELEALTAELVRGLGLGGRDRIAGSRAERARSSVQRRLRDAIRRVAEQDAKLGRHLELSVKTGTFCMYAPTWPEGTS
jgi:hypothetical protein